MFKRYFVLLLALSLLFLSGCKNTSEPPKEEEQVAASVSPTQEPYIVGEKLIMFLPDAKLKQLPDTLPRALQATLHQDGLTKEVLLVDSEELAYAASLLAMVEVKDRINEPTSNINNSITVLWQDGTSSFISLNGRNLEATVKGEGALFRLQGFDELWLYLESFVEQED